MTVSHAVVTAVAEAKGVDPMDLTPLGTVIDSDALEALVTPPTTLDHVAFHYSGYDVTVSPDGRVDLRPTTDT